jgi:hypothetical protein
MKPLSCSTCKGTRRTSDGTLCQNCSRVRRVRNPALNSQPWTPAQVGQALKMVLYVGMAAGVWALNHYFGGDTSADDGDWREGSDTPRQAATNNFSPWEPEL